MKIAVRLRAFAKINYVLSIKGVREDGYHEISTVFQNISLADEVELERADAGFALNVEPVQTNVGPAKENTVYRAWELLRELTGLDLPIQVTLHKKIPAGAGLGGASADAAAFLVGTNELFGLGLGSEDLANVGLGIGADVPFCISGGTALGTGVGENLSPLPAPPDHRLLLLKPESSAETAGIYKAYDEHPMGEGISTEPVEAVLREQNLRGLAAAVGNDLAPVTRHLVPEVAVYEKELIRAGASGASMTGSGTAVYGIFATEKKAQTALSSMKAPFAGIYEPVPQGVELAEF
ncbi:MAG: 4-(cytidine 5'-diphospho)-2-C-methyl-D-erythritol kinase [Rubrobacteraceae bacterium]